MEKKALQMSLQRKTSYMGCLLCQNIFVINRVICHSEIIFFFFFFTKKTNWFLTFQVIDSTHDCFS